MCQSLVNKVAQSEQLAAVADPEVIVLFEDWLEELEQEILRIASTTRNTSAGEVADAAGLSRAGAAFILAKLQRDGKL